MGLAIGKAAQVEPFHTSATSPTATQVVSDEHDTAARSADPLSGLGIVWIAQLVPSQRSTMPVLLVSLSPTAVQAFAAVHDTLPSRASGPTAGVLSIVQLVPSHRSARGLVEPPEVCTM